jgi:hypothetical protein
MMAKPNPPLAMWRRRKLSADEIALGRSIFGDEIDWARVRVMQAPWLGFGAMVPRGHTVVFSRWRACEDFSCTSLGEQGWLIHELMHVWQAARGVFLAGAKLSALGKRAYVYEPKPGARLGDYNIERQAEIARHLFLARHGLSEPGMASREWLEDIWKTRTRVSSSA